MTARSYVVGFALAMSVSGCGGSDSPSESSDELNPNSISIEQFMELARSSEVSCESSDACPPALAQLYINKGFCTAWMIDDQTMVTNSHCVEDLAPGQSCKDVGLFNFPATQGYPRQIVGCKTILEKSELTDNLAETPDYAFVELEQAVDRPALVARRMPVVDGAMVYSTSIDPLVLVNEDQEVIKLAGHAKVKSCQAKQFSYFTRFHNLPHHHAQMASDCSDNVGTIQGNSGSPLFNEAGEVISVVAWGTAHESHLRAAMAQTKGLDFEEEIRPFTGFSSFACLQTPQVDKYFGPKLESCEEDVYLSDELLVLSSFRRTYLDELETFESGFLSSIKPSLVLHELAEDADKLEFSVTLACLKAPTTYSSDVRPADQGRGLTRYTGHQRLKNYTGTGKTALNRYFQLKIEAYETAAPTFDFDFSLRGDWVPRDEHRAGAIAFQPVNLPACEVYQPGAYELSLTPSSSDPF